MKTYGLQLKLTRVKATDHKSSFNRRDLTLLNISHEILTQQ